MKPFSILLLLVCCTLSATSYAQQEEIIKNIKSPAADDALTCNSPFCGCAGNSQAPLGVMNDHIHSKGQWMFSYTYMNTTMQGNNMGTTHASDNTVYKNYMMAPETMNMQMHMAMLMYGITDRLTVMAMGGFMTNSMSMNMSSAMMSMPGMTMMPGNMTMQSSSSGLTDTRLTALYNFSSRAGTRFIGSMGLSLPTGSIRATGTTMLGENQRLSYDMQPGSGSYGIEPGITYGRKYTSFYWGADAGADIKLNYNPSGYRNGNVYQASAWAGYQFLPFISATLRAEDVYTGRISGADPAVAIPVNELIDPTANTGNYGGTCMSMYAGLNFYLMKPFWERFRLMAEYGMPVYQNLNGTQISRKSNLLAGLQFSF